MVSKVSLILQYTCQGDLLKKWNYFLSKVDFRFLLIRDVGVSKMMSFWKIHSKNMVAALTKFTIKWNIWILFSLDIDYFQCSLRIWSQLICLTSLSTNTIRIRFLRLIVISHQGMNRWEMQWEETLIATLTSICFTMMISSLKRLGICQNMQSLKNLREFSLVLKSLRKMYNHHLNQSTKLLRWKQSKNNNHLFLKRINKGRRILHLSLQGYLNLNAYLFQCLLFFPRYLHKAVYLSLRE